MLGGQVRKRKQQDKNAKRWSASRQSAEHRKKLDESLPDFLDQPEKYDVVTWCELMRSIAEYAHNGKRERAYLMREPSKVVTSFKHIFDTYLGEDVIRRNDGIIVLTCQAIRNLCSGKERCHREAFVAHAEVLIPMLRRALRCWPAMEDALKVIAELSYQSSSVAATNFVEGSSAVIPDILRILEMPHVGITLAGQACRTLCNLCFKAGGNLDAVVASPFCKDRQFITLLDRHSTSEHSKFFEQYFSLLATLTSDDGFRALIGAEEVEKFLQIPLIKSGVVEQFCVLNTRLLADTAESDGIEDAFSAQQSLSLVARICEYVDTARNLKNSCIKRCLMLMKGLLKKPVQVHSCLPAVVESGALKSMCTLLHMSKTSAINAGHARDVLHSLITPETALLIGLSEQQLMAVEENFVRLNTAIEKRKSLEDNAGLERAISSLLSSLGHENPRDALSASPPASPHAPPVASPPTSPLESLFASSPASPPGRAVPAIVPRQKRKNNPPREPPPSGLQGRKRNVSKQEDALEAIKKTLDQDDMTKVRRFRISICGQFATGKSSLCDSLRNKPFLRDRDSTLVATIEDYIFSDDCLADTAISAADFISREASERIKEEERLREEELKEPTLSAKRHTPEVSGGISRPSHHPHIPPTPKPRMATANPSKGAASVPTGTSDRRLPNKDKKPAVSFDHRAASERVVASAEAHTQHHTAPIKQDNDELPVLTMKQLQDKILKDILDDTDIMRHIKSSEVVMSVMDSGGQSVFSSIQHLLMGEEYVIYLLCFNSSESLTAKEVQKYIRLIPHKEKKITPVLVPDCLRNVDHIRHWLTAIHFAKNDDGEGPPATLIPDGCFLPPVIFVGTFADVALNTSDVSPQQMKSNRLSDIKKYLWSDIKKFCERSPTFQAMENGDRRHSTAGSDSLYLVDNTLSGTTDACSGEILALCNHLKKAMHSGDLGQQEIKKGWLRFEWVLQYLRRNLEKSEPRLSGYTDRAYIWKLASRVCGISDKEEFERMLQYYDKLRLIIYRPHSRGQREVVIYDVMWFIEMFNHLIYGPDFNGTVEGHEEDGKPPDVSASDRRTLWTTGVLLPQLVEKAWRTTKEINKILLDILTSFDLIYPNGDDSYLVPFALLRPPDGTIPQTMRDGPKRRIVGHTSKMMCITTCDMPLLFKLHPDNENIVSDDDPDMPLPHSAFLRLIIQLIREWKMVPRRALELQYNSAWMTVPNESINLNGFDKCSVSVFLAHYEVSGAILFSVFIEQAVETFKPDHVTSQEGGSVKIAEVLCRIRTTLTDFVRQLHGSERVCPKLFYLPIPPQCNCSQDAAGDDLGNASWKIRVNGEGYLPANPPCACDKTCAIPVNARAWFDKTSRFELVQSNKEAQQQYQDFMNQQIKKQRPLTDLWKSREFGENYSRFVKDLPPADFRVECKGHSLISDGDNSLLMTKERDGPVPHNEYLIGRLKIGGTCSFLLFCKVLRKMGSAFEPDAKAMEDVAQRHPNLEL